MPKINWQPSPPRTLGVQATIGDRHAEVLQAYQGQWITFFTIDGLVCKRMVDEPRYESHQAALSRATKFLRGEITPETWPAEQKDNTNA